MYVQHESLGGSSVGATMELSVDWIAYLIQASSLGILKIEWVPTK